MQKTLKKLVFTLSLAVTLFFGTTLLYISTSKSAENVKNFTTEKKLNKSEKNITSKLEKDQVVKTWPQLIDKYFNHIFVVLSLSLFLAYFLGYRPVYGSDIMAGEERRFIFWSRKGPPHKEKVESAILVEKNEEIIQTSVLSSGQSEKSLLSDKFESIESKKRESDLLAKALIDQSFQNMQKINSEANNLFDQGNFLKGFSLLEKEDFSPEELAWRAFFYGIEKGHPEAQDKLKMLANNNPENEDVHRWYYYALNSRDEEDIPTIFNEIEDILEKVSKESICVKYISAKSKIIKKNKSLDESIRFLKEELDKVNELKNKAVLFQTLANRFFEKYGEQCWQGMAFLETARKSDPTETNLLFNLAYKYSEKDNKPLALYHYINLHRLDSNYNYGLNNIGACSVALGLSFTAVEYYEKSWKENKETYSAANLAYLYMQKGFYKDAEDIILEARKEYNYHDRVDEAITHLKKIKKEEVKKKDSFVNEGKEFSKWIEKTTDGLLHSDINLGLLVGEYEGEPSNLKILSENSGEMSSVGLFDKIQGKSTVKKISLEIKGSTISFSWGDKDQAPNNTSLLSIAPETGSGLLVFNENEKTLEGFYARSYEKNKLIEWKLKK